MASQVLSRWPKRELGYQQEFSGLDFAALGTEAPEVGGGSGDSVCGQRPLELEDGSFLCLPRVSQHERPLPSNGAALPRWVFSPIPSRPEFSASPKCGEANHRPCPGLRGGGENACAPARLFCADPGLPCPAVVPTLPRRRLRNEQPVPYWPDVWAGAAGRALCFGSRAGQRSLAARPHWNSGRQEGQLADGPRVCPVELGGG